MPEVKRSNRNSDVFIFPHIPKCAGTSLLKQFETQDINIFRDYEFPPHLTNRYFKDACTRRNTEYHCLDFNSFDLVFGHFPISRYQRPSYRYVALLRDPVDRAISHYSYWKNLPSENLIAIYRNPIISDIKNGSLDFYGFIEQNNLDGFYENYLCGKEPKDFSLVGFFDDMKAFYKRLSNLLNIQLDPSIHLRKSQSLSTIDLEHAKCLLKSDYAIYDKFRNYWG